MRWEKLPTFSGGPGPRWGHSCNAVNGGRLVFVFGGYDGLENRHTNKVHVFDPGQETVPSGSEGIKSFQARATQSMTGKLLRVIILLSSGASEPKQKHSGSFNGMNPSGTQKELVNATAMESGKLKTNKPGDLHSKESESNGDMVTGNTIMPEKSSLNVREDVLLGDALTSSGMLQEENKLD